MTDDILAMLAANDVLPSTTGWEVRPAAGGLNSRVCLVAREGREPAFVVRISQPGREWVLRREAAALEAVAQSCGCAQQVIALLETTPLLLVLAYAPGNLLELNETSDAQIAALASCLAAIHTQQREHFTIWPKTDDMFGTRAQTFVARLQAVERYASFSTSTSEELARQVRFTYQRLMTAALAGEGWDEHTFSLLHGDLSHGNIIWDGPRVTLIDWEYTRAGDAAEDLAYLLAEQQVSGTRKRLLLEQYVQHSGDATAVTRVPMYTALVALDSALWWADRFLDMGEEPMSSSEVRYHLMRAREAMNPR